VKALLLMPSSGWLGGVSIHFQMSRSSWLLGRWKEGHDEYRREEGTRRSASIFGGGAFEAVSFRRQTMVLFVDFFCMWDMGCKGWNMQVSRISIPARQ
jgi:hypothetical protein